MLELQTLGFANCLVLAALTKHCMGLNNRVLFFT